MRFPLASNVIRANSTHNTFGKVRKNKDGSDRVHQGWDFAAPIGTPCYAVAAGTVKTAGTHKDYGRYLLLELDEIVGGARWAYYAHLDHVEVAIGARVVEGQPVGRTGNSGNAVSLHDSEDHLHFEARTTPSPGLGLAGRVSPLTWFGTCPLKAPIEVP